MVAALNCCTKSQRLVELKFAHMDLLQLQSLHQAMQRQEALQELADKTGFRDQELLRKLHEAGFNAHNLHALHWLPIALVAWASHGVSPDEVQAARLVNLYTLFAGNAASNELFQSWLKERPSDKLVKLWEEFVRAQVASANNDCPVQTGEAVLYIARRVAQASGGLLGLGQVSTAEQRVLDRIQAVYGIERGHSPAADR